MILEVDIHNLLTVAWFLEPSVNFSELICHRGREQVAACPAAEVVQPGGLTEFPAEDRSWYNVSRRGVAETFSVACCYNLQRLVVVFVADFGPIVDAATVSRRTTEQGQPEQACMCVTHRSASVPSVISGM